MPRNPYISHGSTSEQNMLSDLIAECIKIYGHESFYIPRKIVKLDGILNEDVVSQFPDAFMTEMYIESIDGFEGDGKLITKFGLEIRDQLTFVVSVRRWNQLVGRFGYPEEQVKPREGDLVYLPMTKGIFEIKFVEDKKPFFQLNNSPVYKLIAELYEYPSTSDFDTGIDEIDHIQHYSSNGYSVKMEYLPDAEKFIAGDKVILTFGSDETGSAEILDTKETEVTTEDIVFIGPITYDSGVFEKLIAPVSVIHSVTDVVGDITEVYTISTSPDLLTNKNDDNAQNSVFEIEGNMFIDWSESNPFSE